MDYDDERCCFSYLPITRGAQIIGAVYSLLVLLSIYTVDGPFFTVVEKVWLVLEVVSIVLLFVGTTERHRNSRFLIPFGVLLVLSAILATLFYIISCALPNKKYEFQHLFMDRPMLGDGYFGQGSYLHEEIVTRIGGVAGFFAYAITMVLYCSWIRVIHRCYKHIRMQELQAYDVIH